MAFQGKLNLDAEEGTNDTGVYVPPVDESTTGGMTGHGTQEIVGKAAKSNSNTPAYDTLEGIPIVGGALAKGGLGGIARGIDTLGGLESTTQSGGGHSAAAQDIAPTDSTMTDGLTGGGRRDRQAEGRDIDPGDIDPGDIDPGLVAAAAGGGAATTVNPTTTTAPTTVAPAETPEDKARKMAETAAMGAQSRALGASQASGLSGAAGANAGTAAGVDTYSNVYPNAALGMESLKTQERGQDIGLQAAKYGVDVPTQLKREENTAAQQGQFWSGLGQAAQWLFSDRNLKTGISDTSDTRVRDGDDLLSHVARNVRGKLYSYKGSPGHQEVGVMAQDLEKTPLKSTVRDTPDGKMVDTARLTTANTAMISDLSRKLDKAMEYIGGMK